MCWKFIAIQIIIASNLNHIRRQRAKCKKTSGLKHSIAVFQFTVKIHCKHTLFPLTDYIIEYKEMYQQVNLFKISLLINNISFVVFYHLNACEIFAALSVSLLFATCDHLQSFQLHSSSSACTRKKTFSDQSNNFKFNNTA